MIHLVIITLTYKLSSRFLETDSFRPGPTEGSIPDPPSLPIFQLAGQGGARNQQDFRIQQQQQQQGEPRAQRGPYIDSR